jgi:hypothetical protein
MLHTGKLLTRAANSSVAASRLAALERPVTDVDHAAPGPFYPEVRTLGQFVDDALIGHVGVHRESLRATVGCPADDRARSSLRR